MDCMMECLCRLSQRVAGGIYGGNGAGVGSDSLCHLKCVCHHAASLLVSCVTIHPHQAICMKMDEWYLTCATQCVLKLSSY